MILGRLKMKEKFVVRPGLFVERGKTWLRYLCDGKLIKHIYPAEVATNW